MQYDKGVYVHMEYDYKHTKVVKAKFYFKSKSTGKVITRTSTDAKNSAIKVNMINGYSPYKAMVWYKDRIKV